MKNMGAKPIGVPVAALLLSAALTHAAAVPREDDPVPVAPIEAQEYYGWTNAFRLSNKLLEVVVVPDTGRIASLRYDDGENLLRLDEGLRGTVAEDDGDWANFGGDWFWPVAQHRWPTFQEGDWPPSHLLDGRPWTGRAWKNADGSQSCLVEQEYGEPLNIKVTRRITLRPDEPRVDVRQTMEQVGPSTIPKTLWNISQVVKADRVVLPIGPDSSFEGGLKVLNFAPPTPDHLAVFDDTVVYDAKRGGEHKLGSDSPRGWIAAQKGDVVVVERATGTDEGSFPDGGCTVEMYANSGLGYAEIETLSVERVLEEGELLENTLRIECFKLFADEDAERLAEHVQVILGEKEPGGSGQ